MAGDSIKGGVEGKGDGEERRKRRSGPALLKAWVRLLAVGFLSRRFVFGRCAREAWASFREGRGTPVSNCLPAIHSRFFPVRIVVTSRAGMRSIPYGANGKFESLENSRQFVDPEKPGWLGAGTARYIVYEAFHPAVLPASVHNPSEPHRRIPWCADFALSIDVFITRGAGGPWGIVGSSKIFQRRPWRRRGWHFRPRCMGEPIVVYRGHRSGLGAGRKRWWNLPG